MRSDDYDEMIKRTLPYYEEYYRQIVDVVTTYRKGPVSWLDVGCGTGKMAETACGQVDIKNFVFCDCSEEMIQSVRRRFGGPGRHFLISDVCGLNLHGMFDVVTAIQVNHYLQREEREVSVRNCLRALKKDGIFITFENIAPYSDTGRAIALSRWKRFQMEHGKSEESCEAHLNRYGKAYFPISLSDHLELMRSCGFRCVEVLWLSYMQAGFLGIK